jgi:hypothetical protein
MPINQLYRSIRLVNGHNPVQTVLATANSPLIVGMATPPQLWLEPIFFEHLPSCLIQDRLLGQPVGNRIGIDVVVQVTSTKIFDPDRNI